MSQSLKTVATGTAPAEKRKTILDLLDDKRMKDAMGVLAGKVMTGDRMLKLCLNAVRKTPLLLQCDPKSVLGAMMTSAGLGLEPNTVQQQAFLIPYKKRMKAGNEWIDTYDCQFQIGYRGFITLAYRAKAIITLQAEAIHKNDVFEHELGSETFCRYSKALADRGGLLASFCYTRMPEQGEAVTVLPLDELHKIRGKSDSYRTLTRNVDQAGNEKDKNKAQQKLDETPWVLWEDDMAAKSAIKKHAKKLPLVPVLTVASQIDDDAASGALDLSAMTDPDRVKEIIEGEDDTPLLPENAGGEPLPAQTLGKEPEKAVAETAAAQPQLQPQAQASKPANTKFKLD